jgi:hypothetical protein
MAGQVVHLKKAKSTKEIADEETELKNEMFRWADDVASKVIKAALEDAGLPFLDDLKDEELGSLDLTGQEYDPIIDEKTGARLSDAIEEFAEKAQQPEKALRGLYKSALKKKWEEQKKEIPTDPTGTHYGKNYMVNRHGV